MKSGGASPDNLLRLRAQVHFKHHGGWHGANPSVVLGGNVQIESTEPGFLSLKRRLKMKKLVLILPFVFVSGCVVAPMDGSGGKSGGGTALVCHKGKKTLEIPQEAVHAHLNHGDSRGPCQQPGA